MKIIPLQTPETVTTHDPAVLGRLKYVVELTGAELYAFRALARNVSGSVYESVRRVTDKLSETDIPGLPEPYESDPDRRWYSGNLGAKALNSFGPAEPAGFNKGTIVCVTGGSITSGGRVPEPGQLARVDANDGSDIPYFLRSLSDRTYTGWFRADSVEAVVWWNPNEAPEPGDGYRFLTTTEWVALSRRIAPEVTEYYGRRGWRTRARLKDALTNNDTYRVPVSFKLEPTTAAKPEAEPAEPEPAEPTEPNWFEKGDRVRIIGRPYSGDSEFAGRSGTVIVVDRTDPAAEYKVRTDDGNARWFSGRRLAPVAEPRPIDDIAPGFNPLNTPLSEVDPKNEGYRLLSQAEVRACTGADPYTDPEGFGFPGFPDTQYLTGTGPVRWSRTGSWHAYETDKGAHGTLRTKHPADYYLTRRSGVHNPDKLKPEQVGEGWRLLTVDEAKSKADHADSQYWTLDKTWSRTATWRAYDRPTGTLRVRE